MSLAFAIIKHDLNYQVFYNELLQHIKNHFPHVESGLQGDAWIWVTQEKQKVAVDTFHTMEFEIKSENKSALVETVINSIKKKYPVLVYDTPVER